MITEHFECFLKLKDSLNRELEVPSKMMKSHYFSGHRGHLFTFSFLHTFLLLLSLPLPIPSLIFEFQRERSLLVSVGLGLHKERRPALGFFHRAIETQSIRLSPLIFGSELQWRLLLLAVLVKLTKASNPLKQQSRN